MKNFIRTIKVICLINIIHYWYGRVESKVMLDGFYTTNEWAKAWENSYQERDRGFLVGGTSLAILIIFRKLRDKEGQNI